MPPTSTAAPRSTPQRPSNTTPSSSFLSTRAPYQERAKKDRPPQRGKTKDPPSRAATSSVRPRRKTLHHGGHGPENGKHGCFQVDWFVNPVDLNSTTLTSVVVH